jgi:putative riboflavin transport system substrate-binding protein
MPRQTQLRFVTVAVAAAVLLAACRPVGDSSPAASGSGGSPAPVALTVGLGYIPSVQFAPFYLAQQNGYYAAAGLAVTFQNKIEPDVVRLVGQGSVDIGVADGTSVIPGRSQGIPIKYIATIYGTYPSIVFAKASSGITTAADLAGRKIGIPGKYGSSWIMLQALLGSADLKPADATIVEYPDFGQGVAVQQGAVDAATGFSNNEPVQMELAGGDAVVLHVDDIVALPGPGLIARDATIEAKNNAVAGFVSATLQAMREIAADPTVGLDAAIKAVPELASQRDQQLAILNATIATWAPPGGDKDDYGAIDRDGWAASIALLSTMGLVPKPVTVESLVQDLGILPVD